MFLPTVVDVLLYAEHHVWEEACDASIEVLQQQDQLASERAQ